MSQDQRIALQTMKSDPTTPQPIKRPKYVVFTGQYKEQITSADVRKEMERLGAMERHQVLSGSVPDSNGITKSVQNKPDDESSTFEHIRQVQKADLEQKQLRQRITDDLEKILAESDADREKSAVNHNFKPRAYLRKLTFPSGFQEFPRSNPRDNGFNVRYRHRSNN